MLDRKSENARRALDPDLTSELLMGMRLVGIDYRRIEAAAPFGFAFGEVDGRAQFHFVAQGPVHLRTPAGGLHRLDSGDAVLLPAGGLHGLVSGPEVACRDVGALDAATLCTSVSAINTCPSQASDNGRVIVFSGSMEFDLGGLHPLVALMPEIMLVSTIVSRYPEILPMLESMEREVRDARAGFAGILSRLADVVAALIVRAWVESGCGDASGWIAALRDPRLGRVIVAIHAKPGHNWRLAELASLMGVSRSVFAERFLDVTGITPVRYLTELRMRLAAQWISKHHMPIETAALKLGYASQAAFSRAFKRVTGRSPGAVAGTGG